MDMVLTDNPALLPRFSEFLARQTGLHFPPERWRDLRRGMEAAADEFGQPDADACMQWLLTASLNRTQIEILASHLTVGETYFFREPQAFEALEKHVLPPLIQSRRQSEKRLRLWSAGCSTGEEAYSLAILVQRLIPDFRQWNIAILGTDINPHALGKAAAGIYGDWSFRNAPSWLRDGYFRASRGNRYEIAPAVREMVTFSYLNLAEDSYPSLANGTNAMDVIFCRNVLMYFEPGLAARVIGKHYQSLVEGGWLVVSPTDASTLPASLETVNFPGSILHRKNTTCPPQKIMADFPASSMLVGEIKASIPKSVPAWKIPPALSRDKTAPPSLPSGYQQALALYQQGNYAEATLQTTRLLSNAQDQMAAMHLLAKIHANQGDLAVAQQWCAQAIAADRLDSAGHYLMAVLLLEQGQPEAGMQELKRTLYLDQDFVLAHFALGNLYRQQGRGKDAGRHFDNALRLLKSRPQDAVLPESEGMTAGRMMEVILSIAGQERAA